MSFDSSKGRSGAMQEMDRSKQLVGILEKTSTKAAAAEEDQNENPGDLSVSECAINAASNGLSTSLASAELAGMGSELRDHQIEGIVADSSNYVSDSFGNSQIEVPDDSEDSRLADGHNEQYFPGSIVLSEGGSLEDSLKIDRLSSPAEFVPDVELGTGCLVDRLKEELYLSNFMKDIFQVQLSEQSALLKEFDDQRHHLVSEISILKASLHAALESNGCLAEELADCRYKLEAVDAMKEDLQNEVTAAKIQADEFSATVNELQLNLERSQGELSKLLIELSEAKCLVATLEEENQKLNGIIASETDERKKLVDDRESSLHENLKLLTELAVCKTLVADLQVENDKLHGDVSSLTDEKKKPVEDKESCLHELEVLSSELGESKTLVAVQGMENSYLKETVALMTGEKKRLEEEKESLTRENREVYKELDACKVLMVALQADNANLSGTLSLVTEEKKKLEEEEEYIVHENNRLSSELLSSRAVSYPHLDLLI
ncbi:probable myosin heavy chain ECU04_1000, partial [Carica papaya]|uniref:probable myosin heavy chain ECU04_1000 n=1 Tax=Carica papaya TaxID=3649 RepID=UPI000B8D1774